MLAIGDLTPSTELDMTEPARRATPMLDRDDGKGTGGAIVR
jgi:hypothetical protein